MLVRLSRQSRHVFAYVISAQLEPRPRMATMSGDIFRLSSTGASGNSTLHGAQGRPTVLLARLCEGHTRDLVFVVMHPSADFLGHYLVESLSTRGVACLAVNSRYMGSDSNLLIEHCLQDLGAAVRVLRERGYKRIVLVGNSGGSGLTALYQAEAEGRTINTLPDGTPFDLRSDQIPRADALALLAPHPGRAQVLTDWLDPAIVDDGDPFISDNSLDMFNPANGPPYSREWLAEYRIAQVRRNDRISAAAVATLKSLRLRQSSGITIDDFPLVVHRTSAEPRFVDIAIDFNERRVRTLTDARAANYAHNGVARLGSVRSWLSQWSLGYSRANTSECIKRTTVPLLILRYGADEIIFPSQTQAIIDSTAGRAATDMIPGANHFLRGQPGLQGDVATQLIDWARLMLH